MEKAGDAWIWRGRWCSQYDMIQVQIHSGLERDGRSESDRLGVSWRLRYTEASVLSF